MKTLSLKCVDGISVVLDAGPARVGPGESIEILAPQIIAELEAAGLVDDTEVTPSPDGGEEAAP
jgi:hypothetical protein